MTYIYAGTTYTIPDHLSDILVSTMQSWSTTHGLSLVTQGRKNADIAEQNEHDIAQTIVFLDMITEGLQFFSTPDPVLDTIRRNMDVGDIVSLLSASGIISAIQNAYLPLNNFPVSAPVSVTLSGSVYVLYSPVDSVSTSMTHEEFVCSVQLSEYILELINGDWSNFHVLCAGYMRVAGTPLTYTLIDPAGPVCLDFLGMDMANGMGAAQYFIGNLAMLIDVLNTYTQAQIIAL